MSIGHAYFPGSLFIQQRRRPGMRDVGLLSVAVSVGCAIFVFLMLYRSDGRYAVAAVPNLVAARPGAYAQARQPIAHPISARVVSAPGLQPVARTHEELLALERKGERTYVEFSLARTGKFHPVGPVQIGVWRTDAKHASVQASILLNQHRIDFKRLKVNERISIPTAPSQTLDLVVNGVTRDQITGYVSEPKNGDSQ
jgi:hypothetical protein